MPKADFGYVILAVDLIVLLLSVYLINLLDYRFREYNRLYDLKCVEMRDFTVCFENPIQDHLYSGKDLFF